MSRGPRTANLDVMSDDESAGPGETGRGAGAEPRPNPEQGPDSGTRPDAGGGRAGSEYAGDRAGVHAGADDADGGYSGTGYTAGGHAGPGHTGAGHTSAGYTGTGYTGAGWAGPGYQSGAYTGNSGRSGIGPALRELRRDRRSRMIAGVCGGLGRHLNIDPVVFRILFAVLTFFGGFGLLVYAAAWLFVRDEAESESEARKLVNGRGALATAAISLLVVIGFLVMTATLANGFDHALPLLVLATAIVVALVWRTDRRGEPPGAPGASDEGWGPSPNGPERTQPWWQRPVPTSPAPGATSGGTGNVAGSAGPAESGFAADASSGGRSGPMPMPPPYASPYSQPAQSPSAMSATVEKDISGSYGSWPASGPVDLSGAGSASGPGGYPGAAGPAGPPSYDPDEDGRASRPRRISGLALSALLLIAGVLGVLAQTNAIHIGSTAAVALTIMAIGAGLIIGGLFGRARALIPLGLVLSVPLIAANAVGVPLHGETGDTVWRPVSADQAASPYNLLAGRGQLDLTALNPNGGTIHATVHVGAGRLLVTVPDDVAVTIDAHVGFGQIRFVDQSTHSGIDVTENFDSPAVGRSRGTIALELKTGAGEVEVDRVGG